MAAEQKPAKPKGESQSKEARLARALRANLRRRKAPAGQADAQADVEAPSADGSGKDAF